MKKTLICAFAMALAIPALQAQDSDAPKFKVTPTGRVLMDGALFVSPDKEMFKDGVALPDIRLGVKASYGKWSGKVDVGFANGKVGLKDCYLQYTFDKDNFIRGGSFIHQYGMQSSTSSSMKCTFEEPLSNTLFNASRQIGFMYEHSAPTWLATLSLHAEPQSVLLTPNQMGQQGYGILSRVIARPYTDPGCVLQFGISGGFATPQVNDATKPEDHNVFSFSGNFPTRVDKVTAVSATVNDAMNMFKFSPELLLSYGPVALEAQYFFNRVNRRHNLHSFTGQGVYADLRWLAIGDHYDYAMLDGGLATPKPGSLEFVAGYNYSTLTDRKADIYGGRVNQVSGTMTYYINKYVLTRFNYTYTHRWGAATLIPTDLSVFQARIQILF